MKPSEPSDRPAGAEPRTPTAIPSSAWLVALSCGFALSIGVPVAAHHDPDERDEWLWSENLGSLALVRSLEDVDADGTDDIFVLEPYDNWLSYHCRIYEGGLAPTAETLLDSFAVTREYAPGESGRWLRGSAGDVDGSGGLDLVFVGSDELAVLLDFRSNPGTDPVQVPLGGIPIVGSPEVGRYGPLDFDADGFDDVVCANIFVAGGSPGGWTAQELDGAPTTESARLISMLVPDINGDAHPDIVMLASSDWDVSPTVSVWHGGPGADLVADSVFGLGPGMGGVIDAAWLNDFDADGQAELVVLCELETGGGDRVPVRIYDGGPGLDGVPEIEFNLGGRGTWWRMEYGADLEITGLGDAGDVDGDGHGDLLLGARGNWPFLYVGGPGADTRPDRWALSGNFFGGVRPVALMDIDGDGLRELAGGGNGSREHIVAPHIIDVNHDGIHDTDQMELFEDCNDNGMPDLFDIVAYDWDYAQNHLDCDGNGRIDGCEVEETPSLDCDGNQRFDRCESSVERDCDGNDILDACEIAADPALDWNGDGVLDLCQLSDPFFNCNGNEMLDAQELLVPRTWVDCDGNQHFDSCEIDQGLAADSDEDGRIDLCEGPLRLSVVFDRAGTQSEYSTFEQTPFEVFVVLEAPPEFDGSGVWEVEFAVRHDTSVLLLYGPAVDVPGCTDFEFADPFAFRLRFNPVPDLSSGPVVLVKMTGILLDPAAKDVGIQLAGIVELPGADETPAVPFWRNILTQPTVMSPFEPAWVNRVFEDCNGNGVDDLEEIALEWVADGNANLVPDVCEATAAPPAAARSVRVDVVPNPFNPRTELRFTLGSGGHTRLEVYDLGGRLVKVLVSASLPAGPHERTWDGTDTQGRAVASGVYVYRLVAPGTDQVGKMALVR